MNGIFAFQESSWMSSDGNDSHSGTSTKDTDDDYDDDSNSEGRSTDNDSKSDIDSDEDEIADENPENNTEIRLRSEEYLNDGLGILNLIYSLNLSEDNFGISDYSFEPIPSYAPDVLRTTDQDTDTVSSGSTSDSIFSSAEEDDSGDEKRRTKAKCKRCKPRDSVEKEDEETDDDDEPISYIGSGTSNSDDEALDRWNVDGGHIIIINKVGSSNQDSDEGYEDESQGVNESDEERYKNLKNHDTSCIKYNAMQHISL